MTMEFSEGQYLNLQTTSVTTSISQGNFVELDSSGDVAKCTTAEQTTLIGVAMNKVLTSSSASKKKVSVMTRGWVDLTGFVGDTDSGSGYDAPIVPGDPLTVDGSGRVVNAVDGTDKIEYSDTEKAMRAIIGVAGEAIAGSSESSTTAVIRVLLNIR